MLKAILFDAYGTLISTGNGSVQAVQTILQNAGRTDLDPKAFYARWKQYHRQHMDELKAFVTEEELFRRDLQALYIEYGISGDPYGEVQPMLDTLGRRTAFPETRQVLERLSERYRVCIASTSDTAPLLQDVQRNGLTVHRIFTSEELRVYKPQPAFYRSILSQLKLSPEETLFVGDSPVDDVQGPQDIGIPACWLNRKGAEKPAHLFPAHIASDLHQVCNFIENF